MNFSPDGVLSLIVVILSSSGFIWYRLGKLTSKVDRQGKDIQELKDLVKSNNQAKQEKEATK